MLTTRVALFGSLVCATAATNAEFGAFKLEHGKTYASEEEEANRKAIFMKNLRIVAEKNANDTATYGVDFY